MLFILGIYAGFWCNNYSVFPSVMFGDVTESSVLFKSETIRFVDTFVESIPMGTLIGVMCGCLLTIIWQKYRLRKQVTFQSVNANKNHETNDAFAAHFISNTVNELINSDYVLKDKKQFKSILHTPLRTNLEQLRQVANSIVEHNSIEPIVSQTPSQNHYFTYRKKDKVLRCDANNVLREQILFIDSKLKNVRVQYNNNTACEPILQMCTTWFSGVIRELLVNVIKHNSANQLINITVNVSLKDGNFIVSIVDDGVGISSKITNKLAHTRFGRFIDSTTPKFIPGEPINLVNIKRQLNALEGDLEVVSGRCFLTKITLKIPTTNEGECDNATYINENGVFNEATQKLNVPNLLLITPQDSSLLGSMHLLKERFNIVRATTIEQGMILVKNQELDCLLIDSENGYSSLMYTQTWFEENSELSDLPTVILDNQIETDSQFKVLQSGISALISKSSSVNDIIFVIEKVIKERQRVEELVCEGIANYHLSIAIKQTATEQEDHKFLSAFTSMLRDNYANDKFNRPQAAKLMLMTEKTLTRRVNQHYKLGFTEKLRQYRLHQAKALLVNGSKVTAAAYNSGFSSSSYFAQCFRTEFGFAPSMLCKPLSNG